MIVDFRGRTPAENEDENHSLVRLDIALAKILVDQHVELALLLSKVRLVVQHHPPLVAAFGCLAVAELMLLDMPEMPLDNGLFIRLRSFAVDLAERIAAG
jgi:hypothetical protein